MSNGKRWTIFACIEDGECGYYRDPLSTGKHATGPELKGCHGIGPVEVMPVSEHNADLESLAQELEEWAEIERDERGELWRVGDAFKRAAQLVRAKIEEGGK